MKIFLTLLFLGGFVLLMNGLGTVYPMRYPMPTFPLLLDSPLQDMAIGLFGIGISAITLGTLPERKRKPTQRRGGA